MSDEQQYDTHCALCGTPGIRKHAERASVTGCAYCPMRNDATETDYGADPATCAHPAMHYRAFTDAEAAHESEAPDWCPLRKAPLLVTLRPR